MILKLTLSDENNTHPKSDSWVFEDLETLNKFKKKSDSILDKKYPFLVREWKVIDEVTK